jgi:hypothetical protein
VFFSQFQAVRDVAGNAIGAMQFSFTTGTDTATAGPQVVLVSPPNGTTNIAVNANVRLRFNVPINPITVNGATVQIANGTQVAVPETVFFSNNEQDVVLVLHEPLPASTQMTVTVSGVSDLAGNPVVPSVTHFTTGVGPDVAAPVAIAVTPVNGFTNVGTNAAISVQLNEPMDFGSVNGNSFAVRDNVTGVFIGGQSYTISADGTLINFVAPGPLATGHGYTVFFSQFQGLTDYAGNAAAISQFTFTTSFTPDTTIPQVVGVSPPDTTVRVSAGRKPGWIWLGVEDEGPGIATADQDRVFQRFYRGDAANGEARRSGLGLTIVRQIAEAHGGEVRLVSEPGAGAAFAIWLPA